ncbi:MAG: hypothetical protein ACM3KR_05145 [Deltaproteobacteria bacterium]
MLLNQLFFDEYKVGEKNRVGERITKIYSRQKGKYVIYCCENVDDIYFDGTEDAQSNYSKISDYIARLNGLFYNEKNKYTFITEQISNAIGEAAQGEIQKAIEILNGLENKILKLKKIEGRIQYLLGALILILINLVLSVVLMFVYKNLNDPFWKVCLLGWFSVGLGSLGGFLSISININKLDIDFDSGFLMNVISGFIRVVIAMIASLFIFLLLKSNIFLANANLGSSKYIIFSFAIIAGFSETIVPNIINKLEKKSIDNGINM